MISNPDQYRFLVHQYGGIASKLFDEGAEGQVAAVFNSSFYVEIVSGFACIGNEDLYASPLNVVTAAPSAMNWSASGLKRDDTVKVSLGVIRIGNRFTFPINDTEVWHPDPVLLDWNIADLERGLSSFRLAAQGCLPAEGLGPFIQHDYDTMDIGALLDHTIYRAAKEPISKLQYWLISVLRNPQSSLVLELKDFKRLIGLGPGLSPSGDDFIGGMMVALNDVGEVETAELLWRTLGQYAAETGNPISYAHLKAAAMGGRSDGIHQVLTAIFKGCPNSILENLPNIDNIGHTSGWDCMAGIVFALDCWLTVQTHKMNN